LISEYTLSLSLSLSSQAKRIKYKRNFGQRNYSPDSKIRKHFTAPLPKHFQNLLKFKLQHTKKISNFQIFFKNFLISFFIYRITAIALFQIVQNAIAN
jgi:hypothetical protein